MKRQNEKESGEAMRIKGTAKGADLVEAVDAAIASVDECPECTGNNLSQDNECWDCTAFEYWE